jgi:tRNA dimethylallyltransferase
MSKLVVVVGPTASGKSELAMNLAREFEGEIICADSRTVYRGMDIGTAKPSKLDQQEIPHHLLDVVDPNQDFSVGEFKARAIQAIEDISSRGRLPIMVGGSGLYIDSVLFDYQFPAGPIDVSLRRELEAKPLGELVEQLKHVDEVAAKTVDLRNPRRVMRAIEMAGKTKSRAHLLRPETLVIGMSLNKEVIQNRIEKRSKLMLQQGVIEEAKRLSTTYGWRPESMTGPAYKAARSIIEGEEDEAGWYEANLKAEMALVKKQMTWFRRNSYIQWIEDSAQARQLVKSFLA